MDLGALKLRLLRDKFSLKDIDNALTWLKANQRAFLYANRNLGDMTFYIVFRNTGSCRVFKSFNGKIVEDKLDISYANSRDLIGSSSWIVRRAYRVTFDSGSGIAIQRVEFKDLHKILFSLVEPVTLKYVVGIEDGQIPSIITMDYTSYKNLSFDKLKSCMLSSYRHSLSMQEVTAEYKDDLNFYLVEYW